MEYFTFFLTKYFFHLNLRQKSLKYGIVMILSNACDYGIRAALYVATQTNRPFVPIREISQNLSISFHFLTKILQTLNQHGIMTSFRGPKGGVALARKPEQIFLIDIVQAIDGSDLFKKCLLGLNECGDDHPCPLHDQWAAIRGEIQKLFEQTSLKEISEKIIRDGFRITNLES